MSMSKRKRPLTNTPLCSSPHSPHSLLFSQSKIIFIFMPVLIEINLPTIDSCWYSLPF